MSFQDTISVSSHCCWCVSLLLVFFLLSTHFCFFMMDDYLQFMVHWLDDPESNGTMKRENDDNYGEDCEYFLTR